MAISDVIEKFGRAVFEAPFGANRIAKDAPELAEIRLAVIDAAKERSHRVSGKNVFPYNLIRIHLLGVPEEQADIFRGEFLSTYFAQELKTALARSSFRFPDDLVIELCPNPRLPAPAEQWLSIETGMLKQDPVNGPTPSGAHKLVIMTGTANVPELLLEKTRTNIGRTAEVSSMSGPLRRNDLAFAEDNAINRTVSREHAHILRSQKTGECRILNDRTYKGDENCGIWIVREGLGQPVHRNSRGTLLKPGDEIHLGSAIIRFESV
ncbi:MAG: FHA domain-containing protein [Acidobacteriaceae bacterium]|nr:FHA domain-containing protein [Acidobacteriaceae bacterium]